MQLPDLTQEEHGRKGEAVVSLAPFSELPGLGWREAGGPSLGGKAGEWTKENICGVREGPGRGLRAGAHPKRKTKGWKMQELQQDSSSLRDSHAGTATGRAGQGAGGAGGAENSLLLLSVPR